MQRNYLKSIENKRIFITGGTGFFGKSLLMHCNDLKRNKIVLLSRNQGDIIGDVRDFKYPGGDFDYIYHGAATSSKIIPDEEMKSVIVEGTRHVLKFAKKTSAKLLFVSSGAVYGKHIIPINEEMLCTPDTVYGRAKFEAEQMCLDSGIPCSIARCFAFIGEYLPLDTHFAIGNFIRDCLNNEPIRIKGDGTPLRTYLYAGDLAHWLWTILINGENGRSYNVGSDHIISIGELAKIVREVANTKNEIYTLSDPFGIPQCYIPDIRRAHSELGLNVKVLLKEAIQKTIKYHKKEIYEKYYLDRK